MRKIIVFVALIIAGWFGYGYFFTTKKTQDEKPPIKVSLVIAEKKSVPISVSLSGNIIAYETVSIKSRLDSQIMEVKFKDGDAVTKDQILFLLDDRSLKAQLAEEQAKLTNAKLQYERAKKLLDGKFVAQEQVDDAKAAYDSAKASAENTKIMLSYTEIKSPINGRAGTINVTTGNNVKANDNNALVTINQVQPIRAQFAIPDRYYEQVKSAMSAGDVAVSAKRDGAENPSIGKLEYIDNQINQTTGSFVARAVFSNEKEELWPGMFVGISLELGSENSALTIPAIALQGDESKHFVFKAVEGKAVKTPVEARTSGDLAIIASGLAEGEQVISDGLLRVTDGASIVVDTPKAEK